MNETSLRNSVSSLANCVEKAAATANQRRLIALAVMGGLLLAGGLYLRYLYRTITEFAEPNVIVELAAAQVEPQINSEIDRLDVVLKAEAPGLINQAEKLVLDAPPQIAQEANRFLASQFDEHITKLEEQSYDLVSGMLKEAIDRSVDKGININDKQQVDKLLEDAVPLVRDELRKVISRLYAEYAAGADGIGSFVERLTTATNLSPLEQHQREVLLTGLALIKKIEADPSRAPLQGVIEGRSPAVP
jgi:hypothetical protein